MILKEKEVVYSYDKRQQAGDKQEQDVAFYLRRAFKDSEDIFIFNDLRVEHNDEVAQIDHLVLYIYGFILIESKSITGEVKVNVNEEWSRSYNEKWSGIKSPIKQVELQQRLLRELLFEKRHEILPKKLFGKLQQSFGRRCWDNICAVSSNAIVDRKNMPKAVSSQLVKSEFLIDKINEVMNLPANKVTNFFSMNSRPDFKTDELEKISRFLIKSHSSTPLVNQQSQIISSDDINRHTPDALEANKVSRLDVIEETLNETAYQHNQLEENNLNASIASPVQLAQPILNEETTLDPNLSLLVCKSCHTNHNLIASPGRYGYYVKCSNCQINTAMKKQCSCCSSTKTKVSKKKDSYYLLCSDCGTKDLIFTEQQAV